MTLPWLRFPAAPIVAAVPPELLSAEIAALPEARRLLRHNDWDVMLVTADAAPLTVQEIGRLREISFRAVGEGTGRARDLDRFDRHYEHLFVWNNRTGEIGGGYRIGRSDVGLARGGMRDLYTTSLFHVRPELLAMLGPALELGRSFVRPEWQRSSPVLLLLWKGLASLVASQPRYRMLFGPVSVSAGFRHESREAIVSYFRARTAENREMAHFVRARRPFRSRLLRCRDIRKAAAALTGVEELSKLVSDLEQGGNGVPVLLRQYVNLGGHVLEFSVDPAFGNALDALIVVDLARAPRRLLARYMGTEGAARFVSFHASAPAWASAA